MKCWDCINRCYSSGDAHIGCANPPDAVLLIGEGGDERFQIAQEIVDKALKDKHIRLVVRCVWSGSGLFPALYDGNTVFACSNYHKGDPLDNVERNQFTRLAEWIKKGVPPTIGEIKIK